MTQVPELEENGGKRREKQLFPYTRNARSYVRVRGTLYSTHLGIQLMNVTN